MNDKPILMNVSMVCALLDGRKTQTQRVVKDYKIIRLSTRHEFATAGPYHLSEKETPGIVYVMLDNGSLVGLPCPYGKPGDLLWVRESTINQSLLKAHGSKRYMDVKYVADGTVIRNVPYPHRLARPILNHKMPNGCYREASRLTLRITNIRVERVQDISYNDIKAEGTDLSGICYGITNADADKCRFSILWNSINAKRGYGWDTNPWVWVIEFEVIKQNVDDFIAGASNHVGMAV